MAPGLLLTVVLVYFLMLLGIAFYTSRNSDNESFFIGNKNSKWWLVAFGMIGTSLSGMTFISVPGKVGASGFQYFQVVIGYWLGYFVVAFLLLPLYYRMNLTSIYTYLDRRFGKTSYKTGALFFTLSRTLGATLRLYLVIKVLQKFILADMGIPFGLTALIILLLILLYTYRGGVKTIVWTDTLQTTFMLLSLIVSVGYIMHTLHLDMSHAWAGFSLKGYNRLFETNVNSPSYFLKQVLGGAFITIGMTGLDQEMMQKNISVRTLADSQKNMVTFCFVLLLANFLFLLLGGLLYLYAGANGIAAAKDDLFPFIALKSSLPPFISVLFIIGLISAVFPSADGALTALTSSFCIDILGIRDNPDLAPEKQKKIRLTVHYTFALVFLAFIFLFREIDNGSLIDTLLDVAGYTYGPLLALFAFGIFTQRTLRGSLVPAACIVAPVVAYLVKHNETALFGPYKIGTELLVLNAAIAFALLWAISSPKLAIKNPWE